MQKVVSVFNELWKSSNNVEIPFVVNYVFCYPPFMHPSFYDICSYMNVCTNYQLPLVRVR